MAVDERENVAFQKELELFEFARSGSLGEVTTDDDRLKSFRLYRPRDREPHLLEVLKRRGEVKIGDVEDLHFFGGVGGGG